MSAAGKAADVSVRSEPEPTSTQKGRLHLRNIFHNLKGQSGDGSHSAFAKSNPPSILKSDIDDVAGELKTIPGANESVDRLERFYVPIETYEGRHRYDPKAMWTEVEERSLIRRLDIRVCAWCCLMFFALQLDRGNIVQALSDNMLKDLHINTNDYNNGQTIFYVSFLCAELPSQLISKKIGPDNWIPIQMICWSVVACSQSKLTGRATFFLTRSLLGIIEGGFIPDIILYLSYFYKSKELPIRLSFFWGAYAMTYVIGAFLAYGILHLRHHNGLAGWRWLFALEGSLTAVIGIASWSGNTVQRQCLLSTDFWLHRLYLPASPYQTASWFRGRDGWFTEREEVGGAVNSQCNSY